jgi:hypothetical protein
VRLDPAALDGAVRTARPWRGSADEGDDAAGRAAAVREPASGPGATPVAAYLASAGTVAATGRRPASHSVIASPGSGRLIR